MSAKVLLFLNGKHKMPSPPIANYEKVICTDGAYHYLDKLKIKPDIIIGDLDSLRTRELPDEVELIYELGQDDTDFEKAIRYLLKQSYQAVDVYGGSEREQDHFLGNLSVALKYEKQITIHFYDRFHRYFVTSSSVCLNTKVGKTISLYPFPKAENISTQGLVYPLVNEMLEMGVRTGIRNQANDQKVCVNFETGSLVIFVAH